ncbi:Prolyl tripeptidyl peptidase precursor [compost metagenome]
MFISVCRGGLIAAVTAVLALGAMSAWAEEAAVAPPPLSAYVSSSAFAQNRVEPPPLSAYGALPSMELVEVSPSGARLAFVTVAGEQRTLVVLDTASREQLGGVGIGDLKIRNLDWIGDEQVMIITSTTMSIPDAGVIEQEVYSAQIYDIAKRSIIDVFRGSRGILPVLFQLPRVVGDANDPIVLVRAYSHENRERLDLFRVDRNNGRVRLFEVMGINVLNQVLDAAGRSVARSEFDVRDNEWSLFLRQGSDFKKSWSVTAPIDRPYLVGLGINGDSVIVSADREGMNRNPDEKQNFFDVNLETGAWRAIRFDFTPDHLLFHPVSRRMIGATHLSDEGSSYTFVDPNADAAWRRVEQAFAGRSPSLVSWSHDLQHVIVHTIGAHDPGSYYLADLRAGSLLRLGGAYDGVAGAQVASVRAVEYAAADGLKIPGYLTTPPGVTDPKGLPLVVLPHGGPEAHDIKTFDYWAQALASRGYAVLQPNFRGSSGHGVAFTEAGYGEWGRKMQTDLSDGVRYLAAEGVIDPKRVCIVGGSYGGYAALAGVTLESGVYRCAVSVAGVSDLRRMVDDEANMGVSRRDNATTRYWNRFMGADRLGDRSLDDRSPARMADRVNAPVLLIHGRDDTVVPIVQSRLMESALQRAGKPVEFVELPGEDHYMSKEATRLRMLEATIRFLETNNPVD